MSEFLRVLLLILLAGAALTLAGAAAIWWTDEERRIKRALKRVLGGKPETVLTARGRGRAVGFHFATNRAAVAWDGGAWCLVYRIGELMGAELIVDGQVVGRVHRGETRRALDHVSAGERDVVLRLVFDDPQHPDFDLELWAHGDENRRTPITQAKATQEANRWLARAEAVLRRSGHGVAQPPKPRPAPAPLSPAAAPAAPSRPRREAPPWETEALDDDPPWDDDEDDDAPRSRAADGVETDD